MLIPILIPIYAFLIFSLPVFCALSPVLVFWASPARYGFLLISPMIFCFSYILIAGLLSKPGVKAIIRGSFPRDLRHPVYGPRRLYGLCWTAIYYFTPLYFACLSVPRLRGILLRLFGYTGSNDITIFPDAWIRDLPLLRIADKCYIANRSTIGTNMCLSDGRVIVDEVRMEEGALVGHLALVGPGAILEKSTELGVHTAFGIRSRMQQGARTGICVTVYHGADIGKNAEIGSCSYIGLRAKIADGISVPAGANVPAGAVIASQKDMDQYYSSETKMLREVQRATFKTFFSSPYEEGVMSDGLSEVPS